MMHDDLPAARIAAQFAAMPIPSALDTLEAGVFASIDERARARTAGRRMGAWSIAAALGFGLVGGSVVGSGTPARAAVPIGIDGALAPSTLLLGR